MQSPRRRSARQSAHRRWYLRLIILLLSIVAYLLWSSIKRSSGTHPIDHYLLNTQSPPNSDDLPGHYVPQSHDGEAWNTVQPAHPAAHPSSVDSSHFSNGFISLAFSTMVDLGHFGPAVCKLQQQGYAISTFLYDVDVMNIKKPDVFVKGCSIDYLTRSDVATLSEWLDTLPTTPDVIIGLTEKDDISITFPMVLQRPRYLNTSLIRLPQAVLPHTEWMGALALEELRSSFPFIFSELPAYIFYHQIGIYPRSA